jgi:hypothetical protein
MKEVNVLGSVIDNNLLLIFKIHSSSLENLLEVNWSKIPVQ